MSVIRSGRTAAATVCLLALTTRVSADMGLCKDNKVFAYIDPSNGVVLSDNNGLSRAEGSCYCAEAADKQFYVTCDDGEWATAVKTPPETPVLCATYKDSLLSCPNGYSDLFKKLSEKYKFDKRGEDDHIQKMVVCNAGENIGSLENGNFLRSAGASNGQHNVEGGCKCRKPQGQDKTILQCDTWPESLKDFQGKVLPCYNGLQCPAN